MSHYAGGPRRPPSPQLQLRWSRDLAHASIPLAQTPWGLTGRAWLQAGAQQAVIAVDPSFNSLGIDSRNVRNFWSLSAEFLLLRGLRLVVQFPHISRQTTHLIDISLGEYLPYRTFLTFIIPTSQRSCLGGILILLRPSVHPSRIPCPLCNSYSSRWILSILGTNERVRDA